MQESTVAESVWSHIEKDKLLQRPKEGIAQLDQPVEPSSKVDSRYSVIVEV